MLSHQENDLAKCNGRTGKNIFRLTAVLCLVFTVYPIHFIRQQVPSVEENGVGGGFLSKEDLKAADGILLTPASFTIYSDNIYGEPSMLAESFSESRIVLYNSHIIQVGENISTLAINFGLNQGTIISVNKITNSRLLQIGRVLKIPNQDGILHTVANGETLSSIAQRHRVDQEAIKIVNELFSDKVIAGTELFIPGALLDWTRLQEINGDLLTWPIRGVITSHFGWRRDPFNRNRRQFHNGIDIRGRVGDPVRASMAGTVHSTGRDRVLGNYVIINHHSGYRTLYAHLNAIRTRRGAHVVQGERIGDVGNTGQSTGPHLHFTVFRNGVAVNPIGLLR
jgi:murein DD-endopeptidase MepM/ murein hydrolase activator NlpD